MKIYPNPTASIVTIASEKQPIVPVTVSNMQGQRIVTQAVSSQNSVTIDLSLYQTGIYFLTIYQNTTLKDLKN